MPYFLRRTLIGGFTTLALVLTLSSCAQDEPATVPETAAPAPAVDTSIPPRPTNIDPPPRPELTGTSTAALEQTARYFLELYTYAAKTGDLIEWERLSHSDCVFCQEFIGRVEENNRTGAWTDMSLDVVDTAVFTVNQGNVDRRVDLLVQRSKLVEYTADGTDEVAPAQHAVIIGFVEENGQPVVKTFDILKPDKFRAEVID
ncbi:MAG: DUF6318 family protein [Trueperella sp.]|nr:DUF6318 family protein [Trueperella sp.]